MEINNRIFQQSTYRHRYDPASGFEALCKLNIFSSPTAPFPVDGQRGSLKQELPQGQGAEMFGPDDCN